MRVAAKGHRGRIRAASGATVTSFVLIEADFVLAAWIASHETKSTAAERVADVRSSRVAITARKRQGSAHQGAGNGHVPDVVSTITFPKARDGGHEASVTGVFL